MKVKALHNDSYITKGNIYEGRQILTNDSIFYIVKGDNGSDDIYNSLKFIKVSEIRKIKINIILDEDYGTT